jgi:hypothetical protein
MQGVRLFADLLGQVLVEQEDESLLADVERPGRSPARRAQALRAEPDRGRGAAARGMPPPRPVRLQLRQRRIPSPSRTRPIPPVRCWGNAPSRAHPARGTRKLPPAGANPAKTRLRNSCSGRGSPPAQGGIPRASAAGCGYPSRRLCERPSQSLAWAGFGNATRLPCCSHLELTSVLPRSTKAMLAADR